MTIDTKRLRSLALGATPGPWEVGEDEAECAATLRAQPVRATDGKPMGKPVDVIIPFGRAYSDASYIAATSPDQILALLDERDGLVEERDSLREFIAASEECAKAHDMLAVYGDNERYRAAFKQIAAKLDADPNAVIGNVFCSWCAERWPQLDGETVDAAKDYARRHAFSCKQHPMRIERDEAVKQRDALRALVRRIDETLRVPAAEYVPAIADVFTLISSATSKKERVVGRRCAHKDAIGWTWRMNYSLGCNTWQYAFTQPGAKDFHQRITCRDCGAWLGLGESNDGPECVRIEIRAAEIRAAQENGETPKLSWAEIGGECGWRWGTQPVDDDSPGMWAGWLAREIWNTGDAQ